MKKVFLLIFIYLNTILYATTVKYIPIVMDDITIFVPDSTLSFGLVAHYKFEGNTNDSSSNKNNGVSHGGIKYSTGIIGKSASFDGVNDYITINPKSNVSHIQNFTISVWTYLNAKNKNDIEGMRHYIFDGHAYSSNASNNNIFTDGFSLIYDITTYKSEIHNAISKGYGGYNISTELDTSYSFNNKWVHMSFVRENGIDYTYMNGKPIHPTYYRHSITDEILNMQHQWFIGTFSGYNQNYNHSEYNYSYKGRLDDLRIYNRALNAFEIVKLYNIRKN